MEARLAVAGVSMATIIALVFAFGHSDRVSKPMNINGDIVGMDGETPAAYQQRARATLETADTPAFALITFTEPLSAAEAARILEPLPRVNARVTDTIVVPLPEPVAGATRADVFGSDSIPGVVAYAPGDALRKVAQNERVFAIEVLPADAAWGRFGIRPVHVS